MAFHETFWVLTGTAAPVIALTAVVSVSDAANATVRLRSAAAPIIWRGPGPRDIHLPPDEWPDDPATQLFRDTVRRSLQGYMLAAIQMGNVCLQALLLTVSLLSVAWQVKVFPVWIGVAIPVAGVMLMPVTGILVLRMKSGAALARNRANQLPGL